MTSILKIFCKCLKHITLLLKQKNGMIYIGFNLDKNMTTNKKIYVILRSEGHRKHKYMQD